MVNRSWKRFERLAHGTRYLNPTGSFPKNGRKPQAQQPPQFPYVPLRDLKLKDKVSGVYDREYSEYGLCFFFLNTERNQPKFL